MIRYVKQYLTDDVTSFPGLHDIQRSGRLPADTLHPVQIGSVLFLNKKKREFCISNYELI